MGAIKSFKKDGKGVFIYKSGNKYEGNWKDDKKDGKGVYINLTGTRYYG